MSRRSIRQAALGAAAALCVLAFAPSAQAEDFFSALFGAFCAGQPHAPHPATVCQRGQSVRPDRRSSYARVSNAYSGGGQAYCVRTCDGRYFRYRHPTVKAGPHRAAISVRRVKPKWFYGSNIDNAATESGKPYSELTNAFRYRSELVAGCTCNGTDQIGLAPVKIEDDPTLRRGDIVAAADGLMVAGRGADKRGASLNFSPARSALALKRVPVSGLGSDERSTKSSPSAGLGAFPAGGAGRR